jgi:hypothetical protein
MPGEEFESETPLFQRLKTICVATLPAEKKSTDANI